MIQPCLNQIQITVGDDHQRIAFGQSGQQLMSGLAHLDLRALCQKRSKHLLRLATGMLVSHAPRHHGGADGLLARQTDIVAQLGVGQQHGAF